MIPYSLEKPKAVGEPADLYITGDICEGAWLMPGDASPCGLVQELSAMEADALNVHIDSYGGDTSAGMAIYNILKSCKMAVTTIAEGFACSAASLIFMAGEHRIMRKSSLLMIHNAWTCVQGNADDLRKTADDLDKISRTAAKIYEDDCTLSAEEIKELLDNETWITPEEAVEWGFATAIEQDEPSGRSHSSAFKAIFDKLTMNAAEPANEPEEPGNKPDEPVKTPFEWFFGNLH